MSSKVESMPWVSGKRRMTRALMVTLATWTRVLPWKQVAGLFRCAWGTVASGRPDLVYPPFFGFCHAATSTG